MHNLYVSFLSCMTNSVENLLSGKLNAIATIIYRQLNNSNDMWGKKTLNKCSGTSLLDSGLEKKIIHKPFSAPLYQSNSCLHILRSKPFFAGSFVQSSFLTYRCYCLIAWKLLLELCYIFETIYFTTQIFI